MYLVCGHIDINEEDWNKYYLSQLERLSQDTVVYTGGAHGSDYFTQKYFSTRQLRLKVCDKGNQKNIFFPSENCEHLNGFESYPKRDDYLVQNSDTVITFLYKRSMSLGSGSFYNVVQKKLGCDLAKSFQKHARSQSWGSIDSCVNSFKHYQQDKIRQLAVVHLVV